VTTKNRLRDSQAEQESIRGDLARLLEDIDDHLAQLPDDPDFEELKKSAGEFVKAARASGASEAMSETEGGLAEFNGQRGHAGAKKAADALEGLLSKCKGEGGLAGTGRKSLRFKPALSECLGDSIDQLLAEAGLLPGVNPGDGPGVSSGGGYSA